MFALDANAVIHALKGKGRVRQRIASVHPNEIAVPAIIAYELEFGTLGSRAAVRRREELQSLLRAITILPFEERAARHSAALRASLEKHGQSIGLLDMLIAGTVLAHGATLVTHNTQEFQRVPGLNVEDWF